MAGLSITYRIQQGDMLDGIAMRQYSRWDNGVMTALWDANPWVLQEHLLLPVGKILVLPELSTSKEPVTFNMWVD